jgi:hypothetical protein
MASKTVVFPDGRVVTFRKQKRSGSQKVNAYARFVQKNIGKYLRKGMDPTQAMRAVAREYGGK